MPSSTRGSTEVNKAQEFCLQETGQFPHGAGDSYTPVRLRVVVSGSGLLERMVPGARSQLGGAEHPVRTSRRNYQ